MKKTFKNFMGLLFAGALALGLASCTGNSTENGGQGGGNKPSEPIVEPTQPVIPSHPDLVSHDNIVVYNANDREKWNEAIGRLEGSEDPTMESEVFICYVKNPTETNPFVKTALNGVFHDFQPTIAPGEKCGSTIFEYSDFVQMNEFYYSLINSLKNKVHVLYMDEADITEETVLTLYQLPEVASYHEVLGSGISPLENGGMKAFNYDKKTNTQRVNFQKYPEVFKEINYNFFKLADK